MLNRIIFYKKSLDMKLKISYNIYMKLLFYKGGDFLTVYVCTKAIAFGP